MLSAGAATQEFPRAVHRMQERAISAAALHTGRILCRPTLPCAALCDDNDVVAPLRGSKVKIIEVGAATRPTIRMLEYHSSRAVDYDAGRRSCMAHGRTMLPSGSLGDHDGKSAPPINSRDTYRSFQRLHVAHSIYVV